MDRGPDGCGGCRFAAPVYIGDGGELMSACVYILRMGRRRPCAPGWGCAVYEPAVRNENSAFCTEMDIYP